MNNFVLVSGDNCGIWNYNITGSEPLDAFSANSTQDLSWQANFIMDRDLALSSLHYTRSCYIEGLEGNPAASACNY